MTDQDPTHTLDVTGENCPMPVVKTKQRIDELEPSSILEVIATDPGSMNDIAGWAESTAGVELLEQKTVDDQYYHYLRKAQ